MKPRTARPVARLNEDNRDWYRINNLASTGAAEVWVYDEIGWFGVSAQNFVRDLTTIKADKIDLHISSPGGDVFDGLAIYQALRNHPAEVTTYVDSLAASAASFIAMAGDRRVIAPHAQMMIHEAWGMCIGNAADMAKMQDELDRLSANLAGIYANRAGGDAETWRAAMRTETWYSAEEAVAAGLADRVQEDTKAASSAEDTPPQNRWDLSIFAYAGREKAPPPANITRPRALAPDTGEPGDREATPNLPAEPTPEVQPDPQPELPAAEPEPNTPEPKEDPVSDLSEFRSRLGLDKNADTDAILAAVDALKAQADTPTEPDPEQAAAAAAEKDNLEKQVDLLATQVENMSAELAATRAAKAATVKASVLDDAQRMGKFTPADRAQWERDYDEAPGPITRVLASIAPGTAVPVAAAGHAADGEPTPVDEVETYAAGWAAQLGIAPEELTRG